MQLETGVLLLGARAQYSAKFRCDLNWSPWIYAKVGAPVARDTCVICGHGSQFQPETRVMLFGRRTGTPVKRSVAELASLTEYISSVVSVVSCPKKPWEGETEGGGRGLQTTVGVGWCSLGRGGWHRVVCSSPPPTCCGLRSLSQAQILRHPRSLPQPCLVVDRACTTRNTRMLSCF